MAGPGGHRADPVHRRQHQLQRLPVPGQLRGRGRVPAPLADQARSSAGVLQRHHRARGPVLRPAGRRSARTSTSWCRSTRSACSPGSPWPGSAWPSTTTRTREQHWRRKLVINFSAGVTSLIVVAIFVLVKFTEGAWLVVILFAIGVPALIRLNREYGMEAQVLERISDRPKPPAPPNYTRRTVFVFVDSFDLATIAALRYARSLRPTTLRAVHFVIDTAAADALREEWTRAGMDVVLDFIDCPDRQNRPGRGRTGQRGGGAAGHAGHGGAAPAQLLAADRPAAARPDRRQDRRGGEPDPARGRDHRPVRRAEQTGGPARPPGRAGRAGRRGQDEPQGPRGTGGQGRGAVPAPPPEPGPPPAQAAPQRTAGGPRPPRTAARQAATAPPRPATPPPDCPPSSPHRPGCAGRCAGGGAARTSRPRRRRPRIIPATTGPSRPPG